jgi:cytochrome c-type biogenesis protein CcmE
MLMQAAVNDPGSPSLDVIYDGPRPEMLKDEAQAIVTGTLNEDGVFVAEELLLKCPSKYEEAAP